MITNIIKFIVSVFLSVIAIILFLLWAIFGTMLLITLLIRLVTLYTIALLNSFISGTPLTQDYTMAIEEVIDMYLYTYGKIINMPKLPWIQAIDKGNSSFRALLPTELDEIKKSWAITLVVFVSYILSFGFSLAYLIQTNNSILEKSYNVKISEVGDSLKSIQVLNAEIKAKLINAAENKIYIINSLYKKKYSINSIANIINSTPGEIQEILDKNKITR